MFEICFALIGIGPFILIAAPGLLIYFSLFCCLVSNEDVRLMMTRITRSIFKMLNKGPK